MPNFDFSAKGGPVSGWKKIKNKAFKFLENKVLLAVLGLVLVGIVVGVSGTVVAVNYFSQQIEDFQTNAKTQQETYSPTISYEQAIIGTVKSASPSVVSIIISKNLPVYEQQFVNPFFSQYVQKGTELQEIGAGSGFIVSENGLVLTNKHVVSDSLAEYTVFTNDGQEYSAKVLALDPVQDLAVVQINGNGATFQPITLGDSSSIEVGQTAIAIGNALGQFTNTVSVGVVSGLQRTISASDQTGGASETLQGIIQTDAAINSGNSGGPLLNLKGEVIGINTAVAQGAQSIGFAIPINMAKRDINQIQTNNKIVYPFLGVRYVLVDSQVQKTYDLSVDYGALILKGINGEPAITSASAAEKAGIQENDVVLELNGEKITKNNPLSTIILKYYPEDKVTLKILRDGQEQNIEVVFGERSS